MTPFDVQIAHSVQEVGKEVWDHLGQGEPFASYRWYRWGETVLSSQQPIYIILSHRGEPAARATFWLRKRESIPVQSPILRRLLGTVLDRWPLLMCESPLSLESGLILPDPAWRDAALETIARSALEQARQRRVSFIAFAYLEQDQAQAAGWPRAFSPVLFSNPGTQLTIRWSNFDDYLAHLDKKMRKHYRRTRRHVAERGIEVHHGSTVSDLERTLTLVHNVYEKHDSPPNPLLRQTLENLDMVDAVWLTVTAGDQIVGCELMLGDQGTWFSAALGRDYDFRYVYFALGYAGIRYAINNGFQVLRWGSEAYEEKRRWGFELESNDYGVFAGRGRLLQWLGRQLAKTM